MSAPIVERLLFCADIGDMGRKPEPTDVYRVAADTITDLLAALEEAREELYCSAHSHGDPTDESNMQSDAVTYRTVCAAIAKGVAA